jgi:hypothetical protein
VARPIIFVVHVLDICGCAQNSPAAKEAWDKLRASDRLEGSKAMTCFTIRASRYIVMVIWEHTENLNEPHASDLVQVYLPIGRLLKIQIITVMAGQNEYN